MIKINQQLVRRKNNSDESNFFYCIIKINFFEALYNGVCRFSNDALGETSPLCSKTYTS